MIGKLEKNLKKMEKTETESIFSDKLIKKCQKLVYKRSDNKITSDEAERCLDRLARLADLAVRTLGKKKVKNKK